MAGVDQREKRAASYDGPEHREQNAGQDHNVPVLVKHSARQLESAKHQPHSYAEQPDPYVARDVAAQEEMAQWAFPMLLAAVLTFAITSFGTYLIWRQVSLTRKAVEQTNDATNAMVEANKIAEQSRITASRPYVGIESVEILELRIGPDHTWQPDPERNRVTIKARIKMTNFGATVALSLQPGICMKPAFSGLPGAEYSAINPISIFPGRSVEFEISQTRYYEEVFTDDSGKLTLYVGTSYAMPGTGYDFNVIDSWLVGQSIYMGTMQPFSDEASSNGNVPAVAQWYHTRMDEPEQEA